MKKRVEKGRAFRYILSSLTSFVIRPHSPKRASSIASQCQDRYQPCIEQLQLAASSYLCTVLKRDQISDFAFPDIQDIAAVYQISLLHMQTTIIPQLPTSDLQGRLTLALMYASLLNLIQWRHDLSMDEYEGILQSTEFVDNLMTLLFPVPATHTPTPHNLATWKQETDNKPGLKVLVLDLIDCWALSEGLAWAMFLKREQQWRSSIVEFWTYAVARQSGQMVPQLPEMVLLHSRGPIRTREALLIVLQNAAGSDDDVSIQVTACTLLSALVEMLNSTSQTTILHAVSLFRVLLSDRRSLSTHDNISRAFWACITTETLEKILKCALHVSDAQGAFRPLTLALVDLLDTLLQDQKNCDLVLKSLSAEAFERIITILESRKVKFDYKGVAGWDDSFLDLDSDTPPAKNLSRMDDTSICMEQEDDMVVVGLDSKLQLSCATVLARIGFSYSSLTEEGVHLMKARACKVVIDFVAGFCSRAGRADGVLSFDHNRRTLRLQLAVGTSDNEDFLATVLFSGQLLQQKFLKEIQDDSRTTRSKLKAAEDRANDLEQQVKKLTAKNCSQSIIFKREVYRIKENSCQDAKRLVAIHASERLSAEKRVFECRHELETAASNLQKALFQAEESRRATRVTKDELQNAWAKTQELEKGNKELLNRIEEEETRAKELHDKVSSHHETLDSLHQSRQQLECELQGRVEALKELEATNENLKDSLEELFSDMVSFATVYEAKESEVVMMHRNHQDELEEAHQNLRREKNRSEELERAQEELQEMNERLLRKLEKYKQRLEYERRGREEELVRRKRSGPVSYINQLHQSTSSDRSSDRSIPKESGSFRRRVPSEKENSYPYASKRIGRPHSLDD